MKLKKFFGKKAIILLVVVFIAAALIAGGKAARNGRAGAARDAVGSVSSPIQKAATAMTDWLEGIYGYIYKYDQLELENESLRAQLAEAQEAARAGEEALAENERLRELLNLSQKHSDFRYETAKVISHNVSNWSSTITISKGSSSEIEVGDCVITEYGALIGQIIELGDSWATVRTVIDLDISVGVLVGDNDSSAVLVGEYGLMQEGYGKISYLAEGANLYDGDTVLTSGKGGVYPSGIIVGTISEVRSENGGQTIFGILEPACSLDSVSQVFIIKDFNVVN